jgi:hypothetical protein
MAHPYSPSPPTKNLPRSPHLRCLDETKKLTDKLRARDKSPVGGDALGHPRAAERSDFGAGSLMDRVEAAAGGIRKRMRPLFASAGRRGKGKGAGRFGKFWTLWVRTPEGWPAGRRVRDSPVVWPCALLLRVGRCVQTICIFIRKTFVFPMKRSRSQVWFVRIRIEWWKKKTAVRVKI